MVTSTRHVLFCVWGSVCWKQWVTLEKAKLPGSPFPHLFSRGLTRGVIRPQQNWPFSCSELHMRGCINACVCVPVCLASCALVFACQSFHHVVKSQLLIRPASLAWRDWEKKRGGREVGAGEWVSAFLCPHHWGRDKDEWRDGWLETRGQELRD